MWRDPLSAIVVVLVSSLLALLLCLLSPLSAGAQTATPISVDSAISISQFAGQNAADRPDIVVDVTATMRIGKGWVGYIRPWFRKASTNPFDLSKEIYQAALQYQRSGPISTRVDLGYILSPIGIGMMDMRPDTNPVVMPHLAYLVPMPSFDAGAPSTMPIASSYPFGGQVTASTTKWDARLAIITSPPNRTYVLNAEYPNPRARASLVIGGGVTPRTGLRLGLAYAGGEYALRNELTAQPLDGRRLDMLSLEGEWAFGYSKITGEVTRDSMGTAAGHAVATEWFVQGVQSLSPRWFVAARQEGANAPPGQAGDAVPTLRVSEVTAGYRISGALTLRSAFTATKLYFGPATSRQVGASLVWARRWW